MLEDFLLSFQFLGCKNGILQESMDYSSTADESILSPSYIAAGISRFPWGPGKKSSVAFGDYVTVRLKDRYLITGVQTFVPSYQGQPMKQPDSFIVSYSYYNNAWSRFYGRSWSIFNGRSKQAVSLLYYLCYIIE